MIARIKLSALKEGRWYEYVVRFVLGGGATVLAGVVADLFGPAIGGLFLAFPAVFCASASLVERHEQRRKAEKKLKGARRGNLAAALDANGAAFASLGLAAFGLCVFFLADRPVISVTTGVIAWGSISYALWRAFRF